MSEIFDSGVIERLPHDPCEALVAIAKHYLAWWEENHPGYGYPGTEADHRVAVLFLRRFAETRVQEVLALPELEERRGTEEWHDCALRAFQAARTWGQARLDDRRVAQAEKAYHLDLATIDEDKARSAAQRIEAGPTIEAPNTAADRIWTAGAFRLFISHTSTHKRAATALKEYLRIYGVCGFVAHEDIEINREWQVEIESALASAHALVALLTEDFHASQWTDQEIGWALGRGLRVLSVTMGAVPYGFSAKWQGFGPREIGDETKMEVIGELVLNTLLRDNPSRVSRSMARALITARSFKEASALLKRVRIAPHADAEMIQSVETAFTENSQCSRLIDAESRRDAVLDYLRKKWASTAGQ